MTWATIVAMVLLATSAATTVSGQVAGQAASPTPAATTMSPSAVPRGPPFGEAIPSKFVGAYAFDNDPGQCSLPVVILTPTTLTMRGETRRILMTEKISDHDWHVWVKVDQPSDHHRVEELELFWDRADNGYLVIGSDEGAAEAILDYGQPVADAGILGSFERCR